MDKKKNCWSKMDIKYFKLENLWKKLELIKKFWVRKLA